MHRLAFTHSVRLLRSSPLLCSVVVGREARLVRGLSSLAAAAAAEENVLTERCSKLLHGLLSGERAALAQAITLVESSKPSKLAEGQALLARAQRADHERRTQAPDRQTFRIGISGPPGVGKSTFIEAFGCSLLRRGLKVAVLTIDPSSMVTGGSILGDKTRMQHLSASMQAYIRPSPSCGALGGVARSTTDSIVLCEAAGYDVIIVETVGVGQSEIAVAEMVDMFTLLLPPGGGDELQGIKRGIMELSDLLIVTKADGDLETAANRACIEHTSALKLMRRKNRHWDPRVLPVSSTRLDGVAAVWDIMQEYREAMGTRLFELRAKQYKLWMWSHIKDQLVSHFKSDPDVARALRDVEAELNAQSITPGRAAGRLLREFYHAWDGSKSRSKM